VTTIRLSTAQARSLGLKAQAKKSPARRPGNVSSRDVNDDSSPPGCLFPHEGEEQRSVTFRLPYPVSANRYWRSFVHPHAGYVVTTRSREAKDWIKGARQIMRDSGLPYPLRGPVDVHIVITAHAPQDAHRRAQKEHFWEMGVRSIDADNAEKIALDALNGAAYTDDKQVRRLLTEYAQPGTGGLRVTVKSLDRACTAGDEA
jgi:crossover junction endodeoxyribonuclease RusA